MSVAATSDVTQLLYKVTPNLNLAQIVNDMCEAVSFASTPRPTPTWDCDDIAILDAENGRIIIGFSEKLPGAYLACLTIATGRLSGETVGPTKTDDPFVAWKSVADRLEHRFPCDAKRVQSLDQPLTPDLIDRVVDALFQTDDNHHSAEPLSKTVPDQPSGSAMLTTEEPVDMDRLMRQLTSELSTQTGSIFSRAIASATAKERPEAGKAAAKTKFRSGANSADGAPTKTQQARSGLFWRRGQPDKPTVILAAAEPSKIARGQSSPSELKIIRDALYAEDAAWGGSAARILQRTKNALLTFRLSRKNGGDIASDTSQDRPRPANGDGGK